MYGDLEVYKQNKASIWREVPEVGNGVVPCCLSMISIKKCINDKQQKVIGNIVPKIMRGIHYNEKKTFYMGNTSLAKIEFISCQNDNGSLWSRNILPALNQLVQSSLGSRLSL